jgi:hypothetical protein
VAAIIRCDPIDGAWQTLGSGRYRGVVPEGIEATTNVWGPDQLSFNIKTVEAAALRPDLLPYTPVELEIDGILVWAGRVRQRPSTDQEHQVTCEGWQYHLDDDAISRMYVGTKLSDWADVRQDLNYDLTRFITKWGVETGSTVKISHPAEAIAVNKSAGVVFDCGPDSSAARVVITWTSANNDANITCFFDTSAVVPVPTTGAATITTLAGGASGTFTASPSDRRYLMIWCDAAAHTPAAETWIKITSAQVFRDPAYESGNASILKADTVVNNALGTAPLLNQSRALVTAGTFSIPEYATDGYQTPRDIMQSVNAYENYDIQIGGADLKTLIYAPKQTVPAYIVGEWSGAQFADASIAGDDIYNKAIVTGTGPDGAPLVAKRTITQSLVDRGAAASVRTKVLPIRSAGTSAVYNRFGDLWLADHQLAPFAGKLAATSGIRRWLGGSTVPPHELLLAANQRIHLSHRVDPDTGNWGRDGFIVAASYHHDTRSVDLDIDDRRDHFESVLQRYGILVDQILR